MEISFTGAPEYMDRTVGYGEASVQIFQALGKLGIDCKVKSKSANIGISFIQPNEYTFGKYQYKIGYTPWESTDIPKDWEYPLKEHIDELWVTSPWVAEVFKHKTNKPIFIYEHGIDDTWIPNLKEINSSRPFRFLHIGEPSSRKDAQMVVDAFVNTFGEDPNYELILKCSNLNTTQVSDPKDSKIKGSPGSFYNNIKTIESFLSVEQMNGLYNLCDVFVYPSWGEGFGLNPLQAMAMGIPTICTAGWATYERYITMPLNSTWNVSPWPEIHPGLMLKPNYNELKFYMRDVAKNYNKYAQLSYRNAFLIHKDYNWEKVSRPAAERLKQIKTEYF